MPLPVKVCAIPYRHSARRMEVLAFRHPQAGHQFVKGTLELGEDAVAGARRELLEESGLRLATRAILLGQEAIGLPPVPWIVYAFETADLPNTWVHWTEDGGGNSFSFFWHPLDLNLDAGWHPVFHQAFRIIRSALRS